MSNLRERFEKKFYQDTDQNDRVSGWLGRINPDDTRSIARLQDVLAFFQSELNTLAESVEERKRELLMPEEMTVGLEIAMAHTTLVHNQALEAAATIIRNRANEII